jgi:hypothetical protein
VLDEFLMLTDGGIETTPIDRYGIDRGPVPVPISGCVGPREDGYESARALSADQSQGYHQLVDTWLSAM